MLVNIEHLYKYFGEIPLLKDINLTVEDNEAVGLVGVNGCGKSTLLNIITGSVGFDKTPEGLGSVSISNGATIGFLKQNSGLDSEATIDEELHKAFSGLIDVHKRMQALEKEMTGLHGAELETVSMEYAELSSYFEARDGYRIDVKINMILNGMGFGDTPTNRVISTLSGGEKTRLALAKLLLEEPNLLILDEPTNHLDFTTLMWLEDYLKSYKGAILIVSHDRYFLNKVCTRICEIEQCRLTSYRGDYTAYLTQKKMNNERQLKEWESQQKEIEKLEDYIVRNKTRASTAKMAKSRQHMLDRIERIDKPLMLQKPPKIKLDYDIEPTKDIVRVVNCPLTVGEGEGRKELVNNLNLHIRRGEHAAIIGANGIGKTSILKLIQGIIPHDGGNIMWGNNVKISYFEQEHSILNRNHTVIEELQYRFPKMPDLEARKALASVLISGEDVFKPISVLSGGERAKLCFAIMAMTRGNVLILDEPTNHLDLSTKEVLEDALAEFEGTIILVSHDRYLLNKVASRIIEVKKDEVTSYDGNFDDYSAAVEEKMQAMQAAESERKKAQQLEAYKENKARQYRSKEQRAEDAKRRNRVRELEKAIEDLEAAISALEEEISSPEVAGSYELMTAKCSELEQSKNSLDEMMEEWAELSDSL
jgi:ATP-binding cassette subfamily F protein 3